MRKTTFKFREQPSTAFGVVARPIADVIMRTPTGELFGIRMLVDSGADVSILSPQIARILEIKITKGEKKSFRGIGGTITAYLHKIWVKIGELESEIPVAIPLRRDVPNLLGRREALDICNVYFFKGEEVSFEYEI